MSALTVRIDNLPFPTEEGQRTRPGTDRRRDVATGLAQGSKAVADAGRREDRDQSGECVPP